jgi:hypothetical protein
VRVARSRENELPRTWANIGVLTAVDSDAAAEVNVASVFACEVDPASVFAGKLEMPGLSNQIQIDLVSFMCTLV